MHKKNDFVKNCNFKLFYNSNCCILSLLWYKIKKSPASGRAQGMLDFGLNGSARLRGH